MTIARKFAVVVGFLILVAGPVCFLLIPVAPAGATHTQSGYWMVTRDGQIFAFGGAAKLGEAIATTVDRVDVEGTPSGHGYWILGENGSINEFGDAPHLGSGREKPLGAGEQYVSMSAHPGGKGYWLFTNRGRVFPFGDAKAFGDMAATPLTERSSAPWPRRPVAATGWWPATEASSPSEMPSSTGPWAASG